jgi:hypothetical protein
MDNYEKYAISVIIVFGALVTGGLMMAGMAFDDKGTFLFALGAAIAAWVSGHAVLFNKPRLYGVLILGAMLLTTASIWQLVT